MHSRMVYQYRRYDRASDVANILQNYITERYDDYAKTGYTGETVKSEVYDVQLQKMNKEIEQFMISVANTSVTSSEGIAGVGVFLSLMLLTLLLKIIQSM